MIGLLKSVTVVIYKADKYNMTSSLLYNIIINRHCMNLGKLCTGIKCTLDYIIVIIVTEIIVIIEVVTADVPAVIAALYISSETIEFF